MTNTCYMISSSPLLLEILKELSYVSSLEIEKHTLLPFLNNHQLCEYLNRKIKTLDISINFIDYPITSNEVDLICKTFSNFEQLHCYMGELDNLLSILRQCLKLSIINIQPISEDIYIHA
ncbi:unnamed protein product, partial [Rotaria sp. Silwood2]